MSDHKVFCSKCNKPVDSWLLETSEYEMRQTLFVKCHGEQEQIEINVFERLLYVGPLSDRFYVFKGKE